MMTAGLNRLSVLLVAANFVLFSPLSRAADEPKDLDKIPVAVMNTLRAKFPKAKIEKWTKETENGKVLYDIELKQEGRKAEADIAEDGTMQNFETQFEVQDLPKAVTATLKKMYPNSTIKEVVKITEIKDKKEVPGGFEIVLTTAEKKDAEVTIAEGGKVLEDSQGTEEGKN